MIVRAWPADYLVSMGDNLHFACGRHTEVMMIMGQISGIHTEVTELDLGHAFECDVCAHSQAQEHPCR